MSQNNSAQTEQQITQAPNLDDLTKAFAEVALMWSCIISDAAKNEEPVLCRFRWLSEEAANLAAIAMQIHTGGEL